VVLPLIPVVGFGLLLAFLVLFGMHRTNQDWLVPLLRQLAHPQGSFLKRAVLKPLALVAAGIANIVQNVDHSISLAASHATAGVAHWLDGLASWVIRSYVVAGNFSAEVAHGFERLVTHTIPREIHSATRPLWRGIDHLERDFTQLRDRLRAFAKGIDTLIAHRILPAIRHLEHAIAVTIPRELGRIRSRVGSLEDRVTHPSRAWLKRIARSMWAVALLGLLVRTLAKRFPWLFCRKTKVVGNRLCGLDQDLLNALLLDTVLIGGSISIVEFAREMQSIERVGAEIIHGFIRDA
jgi:hypothetical protein